MSQYGCVYVSMCAKNGRLHHACDLDGNILCAVVEGKNARRDVLTRWLENIRSDIPIRLADHWLVDDDFCHRCKMYLDRMDWGQPPAKWHTYPESWLIVKRSLVV